MKSGGQYIIKSPAWTKTYRLYTVGDIHMHARGCDMALLRQTIKAIKEDPRARWIGMGDYFEWIDIHDPRFNPRNVARTAFKAILLGMADECIDEFVELFGPIRKKCIGLLQGNHDRKYSINYSRRVIKEIADELKVPYLYYSCFRDIVFQGRGRSEKFRIYAHHGAGSAQTKGGKLNRLERFMRWFDADIHIIGHIHAKLDDDVIELGANEDCTKLVQRKRLGVVSGTYLRTYVEDDDESDAGYGEVAAYEPAPLGSPVITIVPEGRKLGVQKD